MPRLRKMLNDLNASYIKLLMRQIETQSKTTLANWAIDYSERIILPLWLKYCPDDLRPKFALDSARLWLNGKIQFQQAKRKFSGAMRLQERPKVIMLHTLRRER